MQIQITSRMCGVALTLMVALTYSVCLAADVERLSGTDEVITVGDGQTRIVYDFEKRFKTVRLNYDGELKCLVASFDEQVKQEMTSGNVDVDASSEVDPAILSESARAMCEHLPIQWISEKPDMSAVSDGGSKKRCCHLKCSWRRCSLTCSR